MLTTISITNFIIIDELEVNFSKDFNVITGETGAGKSIIIDAIKFCFGNLSSKDIQKNKDLTTSVELCFKDQYDSIGNPIHSIKRVIDKNGKSSVYINELNASVKHLKEIFNDIVDITGQLDTIRKSEDQLILLDRFMSSINKDSLDVLNKVRNTFITLKDIEKELQKIKDDAKLIERDKEYFLQAAKELEDTNIQINEETTLLESRIKIAKLSSNIEAIKRSADIMNAINADNKFALISKYLSRVDDVSIASLSERIDAISIELADISSELLSISSEGEDATKKLQEIDDRLSTIRTLARKYNVSPGILYEFLLEIKNKLNISKDFSDKLNSLQDDYDKAKTEYEKYAGILTSYRAQAAEHLSNLINELLPKLMLQNAVFKIFVAESDSVETQEGKNFIDFMANFNNTSSVFNSIKTTASGGELARLNFALKVVVGKTLNAKTIIFDEIDIGIGGLAAYSMGIEMRNLAETIQVISITHSPQVAAKSNQHIKIQKSFQKSIAVVNAEILSESDKLQEIARMISGKSINNEALETARKLIVD
ncbi:MAG: AAA family ATPase [Alphaproteobacteria bacterium]|nr:AAA family ATPase [Alphaproteobacteria bacterium]